MTIAWRDMTSTPRSIAWTLGVPLLVACAAEPTRESGPLPMSITVEPAFTIGSTDDPMTPDMETGFAVTESHLVAGALPGIVHVFDRSGAYLREIDRYGEGPGEFSGRILPIALGDDRVLLVDKTMGRYGVLDLASDSLAMRGTLMARPQEVLSLREGWVVASPVSQAGTYSLLHRVHEDGSRASLVSGVTPEEFWDRGPPVPTFVNERLVWTPYSKYEIQVVSPEPGSEPDTLGYVPGFWVEAGEVELPENLAHMEPFITRLAPGPNGHLWVVSVVITGEEGTLEEMFTTWVELIDLQAGEPLAQRSIPGISSMTQDGEWLYGFENSDPVPRVHFSRVGVEEG